VPAVVVLETQQVVAEPDQAAVARVRIRNTGRIVDEFALDIVGASGAWAEVRPPLVRLFPGAEGVAEVHITPPRAPSPRAGRHPFGVRVVPRDDPDSSVIEEGAIQIVPIVDILAEVAPVAPRGRAGASASLRIVNLGNTPTRVSVSARSADDLATIHVDPPDVEVPAGERSMVRLGIRSRRTILRGPARSTRSS